jgi:plasmid maintenance system antidote protein VapI
MRDNDEKLLSDLRSLIARQGWTQAELRPALGVSQGHISKLIHGRAALTPRMRSRVAALLNGSPVPGSPLEARVIAAMQASPKLRRLFEVALEMHEDA